MDHQPQNADIISRKWNICQFSSTWENNRQ